jgi:23S rRNA pseudouridine2605 synthase
VRIAKFLAHAGVSSRRAAEDLVRAGRVAIDGQPIHDVATDVAPDVRVTLDGEPVAPVSERIVVALHKPAGVVSTASDPQRRPTVVALVGGPRRLYPVGRLDIDTTGLILLTDDGALAHRLTHPKFGVEKRYRARVRRAPVPDRALRALRAGVELDDGPTAPARVRRLAADLVEITIREGRKRQVRRMLKAVGHPVIELARVGFGPLELGSLAPGAHRRLTPAEVEGLERSPSEPSVPTAPPGGCRTGSSSPSLRERRFGG